MTQFSAHIDSLFTEVPFLERPKKAYEAGFKGVEFIMPSDIDPATLGDAVGYKGMKTTLIEMAPEESVLAFEEDTREDFIEALSILLEKADFLQCKRILIPGAIVSGSEEDFDEIMDDFIASLAEAAPLAKEYGVQLLLAFRNADETPDFFPSSTLEVMQCLDELDDDETFAYLFDVYEAQITEGALSNTIESLIENISHVRIAGVPLGNEPDIGEVNYLYLLSLLDSHGYQGYVGANYTPRADTTAGMSWINAYR